LDKKEIKSSQTLQIIQSRLAYKQQLYTEALLRHQQQQQQQKQNEEDQKIETKSSKNVSDVATSPVNDYLSPIGTYPNKFGYLSDEDNESFLSAESEVDWLNEEILKNIEDINDENVLYEVGLSNANLGRIGYRVDRAELLNCKSTQDFAAKLHALRLGFDKLLEDHTKKEWFVVEGKKLITNLLKRAEKVIF
jgi:hypothetical protein